MIISLWVFKHTFNICKLTPIWQGDSRLPHNSGTELSPTSLSELGILFHSFPPASLDSASRLEDVATSRQYTNRDEVSASKILARVGLVAYEQLLETLFTEHMHEDEEVRYILKGNGYFDVRDVGDRWVRIKAEPGDFLVLPPGIYHRFAMDESNVCVWP